MDNESVTSETSDTSESSTGSESDVEETDDTASCRSLTFSVKSGRSTATVKSKKTKKRVRFKPGASLVLIYEIPNREMLGLKSESEDSDGSGEDSDDEEDNDDDDGEGEDDDDDEEEENDEDDDDDEDADDSDDENDGDDDGKENKQKIKKPKPFARLIAVKQLYKKKLQESKANSKKVSETPRVASAEISVQVERQKKKSHKSAKRDTKERVKSIKSVSLPIIDVDNKNKINRKKSRTSNKRKDNDKTKKLKKGRTRLIEIRATVQGCNKPSSITSVPKTLSKRDLKPSVIDVNHLSGTSKLLTNRAKLQPISVRFSTSDHRPTSGSATSDSAPRRHSVAQVVSASYESLTSVMPDSYITISAGQNGILGRNGLVGQNGLMGQNGLVGQNGLALRNGLVGQNGLAEEESIKRLDPDLMSSSSKRNYAWQIANGTISSQSLRTPSILPFWDSLQNAENNTIELPT